MTNNLPLYEKNQTIQATSNHRYYVLSFYESFSNQKFFGKPGSSRFMDKIYAVQVSTVGYNTSVCVWKGANMLFCWRFGHFKYNIALSSLPNMVITKLQKGKQIVSNSGKVPQNNTHFVINSFYESNRSVLKHCILSKPWQEVMYVTYRFLSFA